MKQIVLSSFLMISLAACKDSLEQKQAACRAMLNTYCNKAEECTNQTAAECFDRAVSEGVCQHEISSSVKDIETCAHDLVLSSCDTPPPSCVVLE